MQNPAIQSSTFGQILQRAHGSSLKATLLDVASHDFSKIPEVLAAVRYIRRRDRIEHPAGKTDNGGRWYPANSEGLDTSLYRSPSREWPWSYMIACRTAAHCAQMQSADVTGTRRIARLIDKCGKAETPDAAITTLLSGIETILKKQKTAMKSSEQ